MTAEFIIELPRDPGFVATARMFASALARHFEIDEEVVEDLKLAISEACTRALTDRDEDVPIAVRAASRNGSGLVFEVTQGAPSHNGGSGMTSQEEMAAGLSLELISALFEDTELVRDRHGRPVVRFSVR